MIAAVAIIVMPMMPITMIGMMIRMNTMMKRIAFFLPV